MQEKEEEEEEKRKSRKRRTSFICDQKQEMLITMEIVREEPSCSSLGPC